MSSQVKTGKAFEYSLLIQLEELLLNDNQYVVVVDNSPFQVAERYFYEFDKSTQIRFSTAAKRAVEFLPSVEPMLKTSSEADPVLLSLASDSAGQQGDVRDVLISRNLKEWEIGISAKNNHRAVKHPRLSQKIDFGKSWLSIPVSSSYFIAIEPVFSELRNVHDRNNETLWSELEDYHEKVYYPILLAFREELLRLDKKYPQKVPKRLVLYLLGRQDFYKVIRSQGVVEIQAFNLHSTLNQSSGKIKPKAKIGKLNLPSRIIDLSFKPDSLSTLELVLNEGWQITFRIHNASSRVEASLKFDINLISVPQTLFATQFHV